MFGGDTDVAEDGAGELGLSRIEEFDWFPGINELESYCIPKQARWLNLAEIEMGMPIIAPRYQVVVFNK
jgi:hypothetical protein